MATKTQGTLVEEIRRKLNSMHSRRWEYSDIATWINEGLRDVARRSENLRSSTSISISSGTKTVTAPADVVRIHTVQYNLSGQSTLYELEYIDPKNAASITWQDTTSGRPRYYWTWGYPPSLSVSVYPKPSAAGTLTVQYYSNPTPLATDESDAGTSVVIPQGWEDLAVDYAVYQAMLQDSDDRWQTYKQLYEEKLSAMTDAALRYVDQAGMIQVGNKMIPEWLYSFDY